MQEPKRRNLGVLNKLTHLSNNNILGIFSTIEAFMVCAYVLISIASIMGMSIIQPKIDLYIITYILIPAILGFFVLVVWWIKRPSDSFHEYKNDETKLVLTTYAIALTYLLIILMLIDRFVPSIPKMQLAGQFMGASGGIITEFELKTLMFHSAVIYSVAGGILLGIFNRNTLKGILHAIILSLVVIGIFHVTTTFLINSDTPIDKMANSIITVPPTEGISTEGFESMTYLTDDIDTKQVAEKVREIAKEKNYRMNKAINSTQIVFIANPGDCTPCEKGMIEVTQNKIIVKERTTIRYKPRYTGEKYLIQIRDV